MISPFKKVQIFTVLIVTVVLLNSCNYIKNVKLLVSGSLDRTEFVETIPFKYTKDLIVVDARINGTEEKRQFIFDTGAFQGKIEIGLAEELGLPTKATKSNSTATGITQEIGVTQFERFQIGEINFKKISAGKLKYGVNSASQCIAPHGIIGANLMKLANWKINFETQEIHFSDHAFDVNEKAYTLEFDRPLLSGTPEIEVQVSGKTISGVLFDVGYNGGLVLPSQFANTFPSQVEKKYYDQSISGIFGTNVDTLISKQLDVSLAGFEMNIPVEFSSIGKALLGNDILEHFTVVIDYENNKISIQSQSEVRVTPPISFIPGVLNDSLWVVNRTTADLPFSLGAKLQSLNGKKPKDMYSSFCDYFLNIRTLLQTDSLTVTRSNGTTLILNPGDQ